MCGIAGYRGAPLGGDEGHIRRMTAALSHRGPDYQGTWSDAANGIWLGHARLSIIDLSSSGNQPMHSSSGRYVITYNGEIYNFKVLKETLEGLGHSFRSQSDTEVVLAAVAEWGLTDAVRRFNGMFAFALWDRTDRVLHLVRDRLGEKPLYYGLAQRTFLFASELKALIAHPDFKPSIDREALGQYLRLGAVPAPACIYKGIRKLPPGAILSIPEGATTLPAPIPYWSLASAAARGLESPFSGSSRDAADALERLLRDSVRVRMGSDVPLGAFLSGGIDSSTVVALMAAQSAAAIQTFTVGFDVPGYDESGPARAIAERLGTAHTEIRLRPKEAVAVIPRLPVLYDEPFADSSQIPTFLVSQLARRKVVVSLSGDGGDELFGGYNRYSAGHAIWNKVRWMPAGVKRAAARGLRAHRSSAIAGLEPLFSKMLRRYGTQGSFQDKFEKIAEVLSMPGPHALYERLISSWDRPNDVLVEGSEPESRCVSTGKIEDFSSRMMYWDTIGYLPDDILVKLDRASMGVGLETRVPFLDHRIVEFAWSLPIGLKIRGGQGKWILREVLKRHLPSTLFEREKMGFGIPIGAWLRSDLRDWAEDLLDARRMAQDGFFNSEIVQGKWKEHLEGTRDWQNQLWVILMFQAWLRQTPRDGRI